ncbi:hypothetical protein OSB04_005991 [Centaurea solstitialis]|uniref:Uncharacterized protein n=1 Tax=Centaurea solstitialis TaxID=347529 RepID=A0AA38TSM6_9ASTR|nr:hypothetical protein OSB04_005991 [Centaurea solstitialis]
MDIGLDFFASFSKSIAVGSTTNLWSILVMDGQSNLKTLFPRLYALETNKDAQFRDRWQYVNRSWHGVWSWRTPPRGRSLEELHHLIDLPSSMDFRTQGTDKWVWIEDKQRIFSVQHMSSLIQSKMLDSEEVLNQVCWNPILPIC